MPADIIYNIGAGAGGLSLLSSGFMLYLIKKKDDKDEAQDKAIGEIKDNYIKKVDIDLHLSGLSTKIDSLQKTFDKIITVHVRND